MKTIAYQCCFCRDGMAAGICAVILVLDWEGPEDKQQSQQFFCHPACFEKTTGEKIESYQQQIAKFDADDALP